MITFRNGAIDGELVTCYQNGFPKRKDNFEKGKFLNGNCFGVNGLDTTYYPYEVMPEFVGGEERVFKFMEKNIRYPKDARESGISGNVDVKFIIDKNGDVRDAFILKSVFPSIDAEALWVIRLMAKWIPGFRDAEAVSVEYNLPIRFTVSESGP